MTDFCGLMATQPENWSKDHSVKVMCAALLGWQETGLLWFYGNREEGRVGSQYHCIELVTPASLLIDHCFLSGRHNKSHCHEMIKKPLNVHSSTDQCQMLWNKYHCLDYTLRLLSKRMKALGTVAHDSLLVILYINVLRKHSIVFKFKCK